MPVFEWHGVSKDGIERKGSKQAPNKEAVALWLKSQQIKIREIKIKGKKGISLSFLARKKVPIKLLVIFARQFSTMIDAGLPLVQCLQILQSQQQHKTFKRVLSDVQSSVEQGSTFADALKKHPAVFDSLFSNLIAAGEVGGILDTILARLATYLENAERLRRKVKSAMSYPIGIMAVAFIVVFALLKWVVPTFQKMFLEFGGKGAKLPAPTQFVIDGSQFVQSNAVYIIAAVIGIIYGFKRLKATEKGKFILDSIFIKLPIFGELIRKVAVARFSRTLGTMMASGVPILEAMDIVAKTAGNKIVENAIKHTRDQVSEGKPMAEPMLKSGVFPSMVCQMVQVGESTGAIDQMLSKIADFYDEEVENTVGTITSLMEPFMMVFLGGIIGGLVVAMYLPIFTMAEQIQK